MNWRKWGCELTSASDPRVQLRPIAGIICNQLVFGVVSNPETQLPAEILERADARHGELAWRPTDIPAVIEAARQANLVSLGGDLQIRAPSGKWGEPVGFGIDTARVSKTLSWDVQVEEAAKTALADFETLLDRFDLAAVATESFPALVAEVEDASEVIFFGWWVQSRS